MRAGPAGFSGRACRLFLGGRAAFLAGLSLNRIFLFERFSAFTKKVSKVWNINHIQPNHRSPAIAVLYPSTRPRLMQADAGFLNHVQAAKKPGGRPGRLRTLILCCTLSVCAVLNVMTRRARWRDKDLSFILVSYTCYMPQPPFEYDSFSSTANQIWLSVLDVTTTVARAWFCPKLVCQKSIIPLHC